MRYLPAIPMLVTGLLLAGCRLPMDSLLRQEQSTLGKLESAGSNWSVGEEGSPSHFYLLAKLYLARGTRADFDRLLEHPRPAVRALGLVCITRSAGPDAVGVLKAHLGDHEPLRIYAFYNHGYQGSVAVVARELLRNRDFLFPDSYQLARPLLPSHELFAADMQLLADDAFDLRDLVADDVTGFLTAKWAVPGIRHLEAVCPQLTTTQIIKAVARAPDRAEKFLILLSALEEPDARLEPESLLALGSALTQPLPYQMASSWRPHHRYVPRSASRLDVEDVPPGVEEFSELLAALYRHRARFNAAAPGNWGDKFLDIAWRRQRQADLLTAIGQAAPPLFGEPPAVESPDGSREPAHRKLPDLEFADEAVPGGIFGPNMRPVVKLSAYRVALLFGDDHPSNMDAMSLVDSQLLQDRVRLRAGKALVGMSARLDEIGPPWSIYGDVPYRLAHIAAECYRRTQWSSIFWPRQDSGLSDRDCEQIMQNVRAWLKSQGRPCSWLRLERDD